MIRKYFWGVKEKKNKEHERKTHVYTHLYLNTRVGLDAIWEDPPPQGVWKEKKIKTYSSAPAPRSVNFENPVQMCRLYRSLIILYTSSRSWKRTKNPTRTASRAGTKGFDVCTIPYNILYEYIHRATTTTTFVSIYVYIYPYVYLYLYNIYLTLTPAMAIKISPWRSFFFSFSTHISRRSHSFFPQKHQQLQQVFVRHVYIYIIC